MNSRSRTRKSGWQLAILVFLVYCVVAVGFSTLLGASLIQSEYPVEWLGVIFVMIISCVFSELYTRVEDHAPAKRSPYFVLWLFATAMIFCVIGVALHVGGPEIPGEVHGTETAAEFIFLLDVSKSGLPPFTMVWTHSIMIFATVAALEYRRVAQSVTKVSRFE